MEPDFSKNHIISITTWYLKSSEESGNNYPAVKEESSKNMCTVEEGCSSPSTDGWVSVKVARMHIHISRSPRWFHYLPAWWVSFPSTTSPTPRFFSAGERIDRGSRLVPARQCSTYPNRPTFLRLWPIIVKPRRHQQAFLWTSPLSRCSARNETHRGYVTITNNHSTPIVSLQCDENFLFSIEERISRTITCLLTASQPCLEVIRTRVPAFFFSSLIHRLHVLAVPLGTMWTEWRRCNLPGRTGDTATLIVAPSVGKPLPPTPSSPARSPPTLPSLLNRSSFLCFPRRCFVCLSFTFVGWLMCFHPRLSRQGYLTHPSVLCLCHYASLGYDVEILFLPFAEFLLFEINFLTSPMFQFDIFKLFRAVSVVVQRYFTVSISVLLDQLEPSVFRYHTGMTGRYDPIHPLFLPLPFLRLPGFISFLSLLCFI